MELVRGFEKRQSPRKPQAFLTAVSAEKVLDFRRLDAELAGKISGELERIGEPIGMADPMIAAIVLTRARSSNRQHRSLPAYSATRLSARADELAKMKAKRKGHTTAPRRFGTAFGHASPRIAPPARPGRVLVTRSWQKGRPWARSPGCISLRGFFRRHMASLACAVRPEDRKRRTFLQVARWKDHHPQHHGRSR